jgi:hypothetical protein
MEVSYYSVDTRSPHNQSRHKGTECDPEGDYTLAGSESAEPDTQPDAGDGDAFSQGGWRCSIGHCLHQFAISRKHPHWFFCRQGMPVRLQTFSN